MRVIGRRTVEPGDDGEIADDVARLQRTLRRLHGGLVRRGVYRFASFEEADSWMMSQMVRSAARRSSKTSPPSVAR